MVLSRSIYMFLKAGLRGLFLVVAAAISGLNPAAVLAQDQIGNSFDPEVLYERMLQSKSLYDYEGILTYEQAGQMQSFEVSSRLEGSALDEKLNQLDGPQVEHFLRFDPTCSPGNTSLDQLDDYYNFFAVGEVRVAGRTGTEIVLMPVDIYRNGYHFVVDNETGFMLRSVVTAPDRRVVERTQFVSIDLRPRELTEALEPAEIQESANEASENSGSDAEASAEAEDIGPQQPAPGSEDSAENTGNIAAPESVGCNYLSIENGWVAGWLPEGFNLLSSGLQDEQATLVFGDGISVVSVFIEPVQQIFLPPSNAQRGATAIYINYLSTRTATYLVSVVGEVPMATAERIFSSLSRN
ncbi:MAG: MucB/RseB C-terminal domain-containing protein [Porticoccaceae bacterium]